MESYKAFEKQKADRAAANAAPIVSRKDEPWLSENIVVKVPNMQSGALRLLEPVQSATFVSCFHVPCCIILAKSPLHVA